MKKVFIVGGIMILIFFKVDFFELEENSFNFEMHSMIGFMINGSPTTIFPTKDSGLAIESIVCDKGANGVWDYESWTLKIRNVTQSRTKCQINFVSKYSEGILNGTDPVLKDGLIPVTIENDGTVKKASLGWEWYKYEEQRWANAVILNNESEVYYDGDVIPEESIESYFVWIPRYKYKLFDQNNGNYTGLTTIENKQQIIEVEFEDKNTTISNGNRYGEWLTHPAFTAFETNGMWVGKFETGYKGATIANEAEKNENNSSKIQIKPNVYSWRGIQISNAYLNSYNYKREYDSHMMKNTEWGAVSYLQHSKFGSRSSVRTNNNSNYLTGYASKKEPTCGFTGTNEECNRYEKTSPGVDGSYTINYFNSNSIVASTTNNYSGIYDISGGSEEYVMGVMLDSSNTQPCSGRNATYNSGFNGPYCYTKELKTDGIAFPENSDYYDVYQYATIDEKYNRRILGDATGEMGPFMIQKYGVQNRQINSWYVDEASFVFYEYPWFHRGNGFYVGSDTGVFAFAYGHGSVSIHGSFRVVLSV